MTEILRGNIEYLLERETLPVLCHIFNGWGNVVHKGEEIYERMNGFLHRDELGNPFLLQCDPEGDFHPWQSLAYCLMAGINPDKQLSSGATLRAVARNSPFINATKGTELGHLLFALACLRGEETSDELFFLKGEPHNLSSLMRLAREAHYFGDFEVCRKFHLTEGLCAVAASRPGFAHYKDEAASFLAGQLNMLLLIGVILTEAKEALASEKGIHADAVANELRETLVVGQMLENHCYYAGHIIELAAFSHLWGYDIALMYRNLIAYVINTLNEILTVYMPLADFRESFLHFGHYRRAVTLWSEIEGAAYNGLRHSRDLLAKYTVNMDHSPLGLDVMGDGRFTFQMQPRDDVFRVAPLEISIRDAFSAVISSYDERSSADFRSRGRGDHYRRVLPPSWPRSLHYEFLDHVSAVGVEVHLESRAVAPAREALLEFVGALRSAFAPAPVDWDDKWYSGMGRLRVLYDAQTSPRAVAEGMSKLIHLTFDKLDRLAKSLRSSPTSYISCV